MTEATVAPQPDGSRRRRTRSQNKTTSFLNWSAFGLSVLAVIFSGFAASGTLAQANAMDDSISEKLVLIAMSAGVPIEDDTLGYPEEGGTSAAQRTDDISVWLDVANNGRARGSITELSYLAIGQLPIPVYAVECMNLEDQVVRACRLPISMDQGEQIRLRVDFFEADREALHCPKPIQYLFFTITDSRDRDLNVGEKNDEPAWDCSS